MGNFVSINNETGISRFFADTPAEHSDMIVDSFRVVSEYAVFSNDFIDSIYIYRKSDDLLISSREGVVFSASEEDNYNHRYIQFEAISQVMDNPEHISWSSPYENNNLSGDRPLLTLAYSVPLYKSTNKKTGAIVINIDEERFLKAINQYSGMDYNLAIINSKGEVLGHSDKEVLLSPGDNLPFMKELQQKPEGFITVPFEHSMAGVSWVSSKQLNLYRQFVIAMLAAIVFVRSLFGASRGSIGSGRSAICRFDKKLYYAPYRQRNFVKQRSRALFD